MKKDAESASVLWRFSFLLFHKNHKSYRYWQTPLFKPRNLPSIGCVGTHPNFRDLFPDGKIPRKSITGGYPLTPLFVPKIHTERRKEKHDDQEDISPWLRG